MYEVQGIVFVHLLSGIQVFLGVFIRQVFRRHDAMSNIHDNEELVTRCRSINNTVVLLDYPFFGFLPILENILRRFTAPLSSLHRSKYLIVNALDIVVVLLEDSLQVRKGSSKSWVDVREGDHEDADFVVR